jgi:hypothetical protein
MTFFILFPWARLIFSSSFQLCGGFNIRGRLRVSEDLSPHLAHEHDQPPPHNEQEADYGPDD